jgi:ankyrin repeat protein
VDGLLVTFAIALGDGERVRRLIDAGASVNCRRKTSESLLHVALLTAKDDVIIRMLVAEGVKLNATACRVAACNAAALRALIDAGAVFDQPDVDRDRTTPLSIAVKTGNIECASVLVAAGANVKWVDKHSNTLLHLLLSSTENINMARVRLLVAWGVDVNARNANGESAFTIVARKGNRECLCTLLAIGASLTETTSVSRDVSGLLAAAAAGDDKPGLAAAPIAVGTSAWSRGMHWLAVAAIGRVADERDFAIRLHGRRTTCSVSLAVEHCCESEAFCEIYFMN